MVLRNFDWRLNFSVLFIIAVGFLSLASANPSLFYKQLLWFFTGLIFVLFIVRFDWRPFVNYKGAIWGFYVFTVFCLLLTLIFAPAVRGARAWINIGPFQFQVSEFAKIVLIVVFASFFSKKHIGIGRISNIAVSFVYFAIPGFLVALQPDFGSVLVLFSLWLGFLFVSGIRWRHLAAGILIFLILAVFMWISVLKNYQKERIIGVFFPERDPLGVNYNAIQSKIAVGSAGLFGKGFRQGTQVQLGFLPEAQTDFIFSAVIEEFGLIAGFFLLAAFLILIFRIISIGLSAENNFNRFVCLGAAILFSVQLIINVGSALGFTPVIGITFPFLSYGGSSLLTNLAIIGVIQSISFRR